MIRRKVKTESLKSHVYIYIYILYRYFCFFLLFSPPPSATSPDAHASGPANYSCRLRREDAAFVGCAGNCKSPVQHSVRAGKSASLETGGRICAPMSGIRSGENGGSLEVWRPARRVAGQRAGPLTSGPRRT